MPGKEEYVEVEMTKSPKGWFVGEDPEEGGHGEVGEVLLRGAQRRGQAGRPQRRLTSPNIILLIEEDADNEEGEAGAAGSAGGEDTENPLEEQEGPRTALRPWAASTRSWIGLDTRYGKRKWWIGIGVGSGYGYAKGNGLEADGSSDLQLHGLTPASGPGAWAGLGHLAPEVGSHDHARTSRSRSRAASSTSRSRRSTRTSRRAARSRCSAKFLVFTKQSQLRFFGSRIVGGGEGFRFVVYPASIVTDPNNRLYRSDFQDTVKGGPVIGGAGIGVYYEATRRTSIVLEVNGLAGFPTFSFVVDVNLALQFNFYGSEPVATPGRYVPKEEDEEPK